MPLTGKYLKYSPKITLEIFTLIWDKLIECNWKHNNEGNNYDIKKRYTELKSGNYYLLEYKDKTFATHTIGHSYTSSPSETTVQEILGYDPFVKEDFLLPRNWVCKMTSESKDTLNNYRKNIVRYDSGDCSWDYMLPDGSGGFYKDGVEITFDQFKKYVLKENVEVTKEKVVEEVIPEYVECIQKLSQIEIGKIYKIENNVVAGAYAWKTTQFKPSTKEAFDAQNQPKQPLKQAVHCKTQEEYKFTKETLGVTFNSNAYIAGESIIPLDAVGCTINLNRFGHSIYNDYKLLSFQEWCDLNGYKMEKEVKFEVGKWYWFAISSTNNSFFRIIKCSAIESNKVRADYWLMNQDAKIGNKSPNEWMLSSIYSLKELSIEEIQQYLQDGHVDKLAPVIQQARDMQKSNQEFKAGDWIVANSTGWNDTAHKQFKTVYKQNELMQIKSFSKMSNGQDFNVAITHGGNVVYIDKYKEKFRHATPEEINNHLISIGQIPAGEPLNTGIEPNKDGMFKYTTGNSYNKDFSTSVIPVKPISAEIEFNYLPEPK